MKIPDPYRKSRDAFEELMYTLLERSARQWAQALNAEQGENHDRKVKQSAAVTGSDEIDIGRLSER